MQDDSSSSNPVFIKSAKDITDNYIFLSGKKLDDVDSYKVKVDNANGDFEDYLANDIFAPVVSDKVKTLLEKEVNSDFVQFIPLKFVNNNLEVKKYYIMNVINVVDAIDLDKSLTGPEIGGQTSIIKYALKSDELQGMNLLRLKDYEIGKVFISEKIKKTFENVGVTGLDFGNVKVV